MKRSGDVTRSIEDRRTRESIRCFWARRQAPVLLMLLLCVAGCRTVMPVKNLHPSFAPDISRIMLKNGKVIIFNRDFGWYNKKAGTIDGMTADSQHVEYRLSDLSKVETVRAYSIIPAAFTIGTVLGAGIYLLAKLLTLV